jgi:hypothetical protein
MEAGLPWLFLFQVALTVAVGANPCVRLNSVQYSKRADT